MSREPGLPIEPVEDGVLLHVLAFPKAGRNEIGPVRSGRIVVRVTAAPEDGKANAAILKLLAKGLGISASTIEVSSGATSREKTLLLRGVNPQTVQNAFNL